LHEVGDALRSLRSRGTVPRLGLVSTKVPELESVDALKRRIDEAVKILPLDQLAISRAMRLRL